MSTDRAMETTSLRRLAIGTGPTLHCHYVLLDEHGNGQTTEEAWHRHNVVGGVVQMSDGHTHKILDGFQEAVRADALNDAVPLIGVSESAPLREAKVNADERVIQNVLMLGSNSVNGGELGGSYYNSRVYSAGAMAAAVPLFEGSRAYMNHATDSELEDRHGNRNVHDFLGVYRNVRHVESAGQIRGDLHVVKSLHGDTVLDTAARMPEALGLSVDAEGHGYVDERHPGGPALIVDSFTAVHSTDLVDRPATTRNLFEHQPRLREHYASGRLFNPQEDPAMTGSKPEGLEAAVAKAMQPLTDKVNELSTKLGESEERAKAAETKLAEHEAKGAAAAKLTETAKVVDKVLDAHKGRLPEVVSKRVREHFKTTAASEDEVKSYMDLELAFVRDLVEATGADADEIGLGPLEVRESDKGKPSDADSAVKLAEQALGRACGVDLHETAKAT